MGLDLRLLRSPGPTGESPPGESPGGESPLSTWGTRCAHARSNLWPIRAGSLGRKNKECGFNAQGPWLAPCGADPNDADLNDGGTNEPEGQTAKRRTRFVVVVAEPDAGVTVAGSDALGGGDGASSCAWRLVAHPPLSIQTALPCDCEYEVVDASDGSVAARGVVRAGAREPVLGVDPTSPLRLRLEPLDAPMGDGESTGRRSRVPFAFARCRGTVPVNDPVPGGRRTTDRSPAVHELLVSPSDTLSDTSSGDNPIRLAVTCEPACATHGSLSGPAPILVDVRAPLVVANGCPFPVAMSGFDLVPTRGLRAAGADVVSFTNVTTTSSSSDGANSRGTTHGFVVVARLSLLRHCYIGSQSRFDASNKL